MVEDGFVFIYEGGEGARGSGGEWRVKSGRYSLKAGLLAG
jgi:hypothetical protein